RTRARRTARRWARTNLEKLSMAPSRPARSSAPVRDFCENPASPLIGGHGRRRHAGDCARHPRRPGRDSTTDAVPEDRLVTPAPRRLARALACAALLATAAACAHGESLEVVVAGTVVQSVSWDTFVLTEPGAVDARWHEVGGSVTE